MSTLTAPSGELGRVWSIPRPVVYRSLGRLRDLDLIVPTVDEPGGRGPRRQVFASTRLATQAVASWLVTPVEHVRDVRSHFLTKLALLDRRGLDPGELLRRQRQALITIATALGGQDLDAQTGFEGVLAEWRRANVRVTLDFVDTMSARR